MTEVATADIAWLVSSVLIEEGSMMECVFIDNRWFWLFQRRDENSIRDNVLFRIHSRFH